jgi:D-3-phosphoglycerate dehydrogenase
MGGFGGVACKMFRFTDGRKFGNIFAADKMNIVIHEALVLDLVEWVARKERSYEETMDAWRTSCPKLPVWEEANDYGLVCVENSNGRSCVRITPAGYEFLRKFRPSR